MRSKATNILQGGVLITGIIYILIGLSFFISPLAVLKFFVENVSENWLDLVRDSELVAPLYNITKAFAAILFTSGIAMVLPLFDPLKYRGLIYYNGLIFPFMASVIFISNGLVKMITSKKDVPVSSDRSAFDVVGPDVHIIIVVMGILFTLIFLTNLVGVILTKKQAHDGME